MSNYMEKIEEKMMSVVENLESNFHQIRTGRASSQILEKVHVDYYGAPTPVNQMAQIQVIEGTQLVVKPYDRNMVKDVNKAILAANLGLNPQAEADCVRILVPQLTQERREQLAKDAQKFAEEAKVAIRNLRREANDAIKKDKELTEDDRDASLEDSQKLTDSYIKQIEDLLAAKKKDILHI